MLDFARSLTVASAGRYLLWRARGRPGPIVLRTRAGPRFEMRPDGFGGGRNNDYGVAYEVFASDVYGHAARLRREEVRVVVDCGANVGLSVLRWLALFPRCRILAFEPHAGHAEQAARNVALSGGDGRFELIEAGIGAYEREAVLSDRGSGSTVLADGDGLRIRIVDVFPHLAGKRIDLMKIDTEGGEYEVLGDSRFEALDVRAIIMEWHARADGSGREWCLSRLRSLGYRVEELANETHVGLLWAERGAGA